MWLRGLLPILAPRLYRFGPNGVQRPRGRRLPWTWLQVWWSGGMWVTSKRWLAAAYGSLVAGFHNHL